MGRKSKLDDAQWAELFRRKAEGESNRALAAAFGISEASIREKEAKIGKTADVQEVARMLVTADKAQEDAQAALKSLPITAQISAQSLAVKLRSISESVASAAELGARTGHRLHALANSEVNKVDDANPIASVENLRNVGVLTKLANDSLAPALNLLSANKDRLKGDPPDPDAPPSSGVLVVPELAGSSTAWSKAQGVPA